MIKTKVKLREVREQKDMSLRELSKLSDVAISYLSDLENEVKENPSIEVICKLAKVLGCEPEDLYDC